MLNVLLVCKAIDVRVTTTSPRDQQGPVMRHEKCNLATWIAICFVVAIITAAATVGIVLGLQRWRQVKLMASRRDTLACMAMVDLEQSVACENALAFQETEGSTEQLALRDVLSE